MSASKERVCEVSGEPSGGAGSSEQEAYRGTGNPERLLLSQSRLAEMFNHESITTCTVAFEGNTIQSRQELWLFSFVSFILRSNPHIPSALHGPLVDS